MVHIVRINDNNSTGQKLIEELHRHEKAVEFIIPRLDLTVPEGYMTSDEFRKSVKSKIYNHYKENGLL